MRPVHFQCCSCVCPALVRTDVTIKKASCPLIGHKVSFLEVKSVNQEIQLFQLRESSAVTAKRLTSSIDVYRSR
jgi:hypothetical protein